VGTGAGCISPPLITTRPRLTEYVDIQQRGLCAVSPPLTPLTKYCILSPPLRLSLGTAGSFDFHDFLHLLLNSFVSSLRQCLNEWLLQAAEAKIDMGAGSGTGTGPGTGTGMENGTGAGSGTGTGTGSGVGNGMGNGSRADPKLQCLPGEVRTTINSNKASLH
jgi:hypothetical protein